jgi:aldose 1-epimerase
VLERGNGRCRLGLELPPQPGYPFQLGLQAEYGLGGNGLTVTITAENMGSEPLPYGAGAHPYVTAGVAVDDALLRIPAGSYFRTDHRQLPVGRQPVEGSEYDFREPRRIGAMKLDTAFADLIADPDGMTRVQVSGERGRTLTVWMDANHRYVMAFTGDTLAEHRRRRSVGIEPMTCAPNAFRSGDGLITLEPGERCVVRWGIVAEG